MCNEVKGQSGKITEKPKLTKKCKKCCLWPKTRQKTNLTFDLEN
jgi:hypothetical protein